MKSMTKQFAFGLILGAQVLLFQNCSETKFTNDSLANVRLKSCETRLEDSTNPVKLMLIVDASGSNVDNYYPEDHFNAGTDNGKRWRLSVINSIMDRYGKNNKISFGMITFQGTSATPRIQSGGQPIFSNNPSVVQAGIQSFIDNKDDSTTPYQAALFMARDAIRADIAANPGENAAYSVVMMSDGVPSKGVYDNNPEAVIPDAQEIMNLSPGKIRLNTVFYHNTVAQEGDIKFLQNIALTGKGKFLTANTNDVFILEDLVQYSQEICE